MLLIISLWWGLPFIVNSFPPFFLSSEQDTETLPNKTAEKIKQNKKQSSCLYKGADADKP